MLNLVVVPTVDTNCFIKLTDFFIFRFSEKRVDHFPLDILLIIRRQLSDNKICIILFCEIF